MHHQYANEADRNNGVVREDSFICQRFRVGGSRQRRKGVPDTCPRTVASETSYENMSTGRMWSGSQLPVASADAIGRSVESTIFDCDDGWHLILDPCIPSCKSILLPSWHTFMRTLARLISPVRRPLAFPIAVSLLAATATRSSNPALLFASGDSSVPTTPPPLPLSTTPPASPSVCHTESVCSATMTSEETSSPPQGLW